MPEPVTPLSEEELATIERDAIQGRPLAELGDDRLPRLIAELRALRTHERGEGWTAAAQDVFAERRRQVEVEGWTPEHDDAHGVGEMARAGAAYALHMHGFRGAPEKDYRIKANHPEWPWDRKWWKPKDPRRDLVRAAALILAEIERFDRASPTPPAKEG